MTTPTPKGCLSLATSTSCPEYKDFSVGLGFENGTIPFTDATTFDAWFTRTYGSSTAFSTTAKTLQGCDDASTYSAQDQRYIQSVNCFLLVDAASLNGCQDAPPAKPLCKSTMATFIKQYSSDFSNSIPPLCTVTTPPASQLNPLAIYNALSSKATSDTDCIPGNNGEVSQCGFFDIGQAQAYCQTDNGKSNQCCKSSQLGGDVSDPLQLIPAALSSSDGNTDESKPSTGSGNSSSSEEGGWSTSVIIGVAIAAFVGLVSLVLISMLIRKRRRIANPDPGYAASPMKNGGYDSHNNLMAGSNGFDQYGSHDNNNNTGYGMRDSLMTTKDLPTQSLPPPPPLPNNNGGGGDDDGIPVSETMQAIFNYVPNLSDEIYLYVGDPVVVKAKFDDGWGLGYNMTTKQEGSFPLACVGPFNNGQRGHGEATYSHRQSSLYAPTENGYRDTTYRDTTYTREPSQYHY